jgi:hypothetical protein
VRCFSVLEVPGGVAIGKFCATSWFISGRFCGGEQEQFLIFLVPCSVALLSGSWVLAWTCFWSWLHFMDVFLFLDIKSYNNAENKSHL